MFNGGRLNPDFVECLMGYPISYTEGSRAKRLKALGNAIVPWCAVPMLAAIRIMEDKSCTPQ